MEEAIVFEATSAEERVEGVQRLLPLHRLGEGPVHVGCAEGRQLHWAGGLQEILIPVDIAAGQESKYINIKIML